MNERQGKQIIRSGKPVALPDRLYKYYENGVSLESLLKDCSIRLLDEVTASLDAKTADEVLAGIIRLSKENNVITLMISHNLNEVAKYADEILVLSGGKVVAQGTHSELLDISDNYKSLWGKFNSQTHNSTISMKM